jgi:hypothetical protein
MAETFRHYRVLAEQLSEHVDAETLEAVLKDLDTIRPGSKPEQKVAWAREAMARLDALVAPETCIKIREGCACLLSNAKSIYARNFRTLLKPYPDDEAYLDAVVAYLNATASLRRCGEVTREGERLISVIARGACACPVLHDGLQGPAPYGGTLSMTWCHCSKGSLLSVYEQVFPERVCEMEILSSVATGGSECAMAAWWRLEEGS